MYRLKNYVDAALMVPDAISLPWWIFVQLYAILQIV